MNIKSKIFKRKSGKSEGKWIVRIEYFDEILGKKRFIERAADKRNDAVDERDKQIEDLQKTHGQVLTGERMTFDDLVSICEKNFYKPAVIVEGRKIAGVRSIQTVQTQLTVLKKFFGNRLIRQITTESLTDYKLWRIKNGSLNPSVKKNKEDIVPVKLSTINRELSTMRRMMRFAFGKGWIVRDIFFNAKVIEMSAEIERTRLLTLDEEMRLLAACQGEREVTYKRKKRGNPNELEEIKAVHNVDNPLLKGMIILAIDSGMRRGEIFKLRWQDIDFDNNLIRILGTHTKTERERIAPLSQRAKDELENIKTFSKSENPFPAMDIKRSFATAKRLAGIDDLHFHDLRRTAVTRWIQQGTSLAFAGKFAGHTQLQTTMKHYTATDTEIVKEITDRMNDFHSQIYQAATNQKEFIN
ncbi:MAG: site-specific integrase [Acidobacteria bacterium]|nr:site-specific integrase [Acidobacteriota bacterium]